MDSTCSPQTPPLRSPKPTAAALHQTPGPFAPEPRRASLHPAPKILRAILAACAFLPLHPAHLGAAEAPHVSLDEKHRAFLKDYCVECHNADKQKGKLRLDSVAFTLNSVQSADLWQRVLHQVNSGEMPPDDAKQPERGAKTDFLDALSGTLMAARRNLADVGGNITMRRLNRREYRNTIRALLGVETDVRDLPADGGADTFDTVGASLFLSPDQFEQYLLLGRRALDEHFARWVPASAPIPVEPAKANPSAKPAPANRVEGEARTPGLQRELTRMHEDHAKYALWQANGSKTEDLAKFGCRKDLDAAKFVEYCWQINHEWYERYLARPEVQTGMFLDNTVNFNETFVIDLPTEMAPGDYVFHVRIGRVPDMPAERAFVSFLQASPLDKSDLTFLASRHVTADIQQPEILQFPFRILPGGARKFIFMEKRPLKGVGISLGGFTRMIKDPKQRDPVLWIDWIEWHKADTSPSVSPIVFDRTGDISEKEHARAIFRAFALRAFRGQQPTTAFIDKLTALFASRRAAGDSFENALKEPLSVVLASPRFLYLAEPGVEKKPRPLTDTEFATRLSYFLWSAPPDETLLSLAQKNALHDPSVLAREVDRMIADPKADEFVSGFVHQWLGMDRLDFFQFDPRKFRDFDESTRAAARTEVFETFAYLLRNNRSLSQLLKSDTVVINALLARYYGIEDVSGDAFRPVRVAEGSPRGGLLGMAAVLAMGSNGERSSPVERGAWVLRKLLNEPPPAAPPNVPMITRLNGQALTTRERLLAHQEEPQCASCHRKIDPIGFGLENFDAAGKWREEDSFQATDPAGKPIPRGLKKWKIDPVAAFHKGPEFQSYFEMRDIVAGKAPAFARGFTEQLIAYSLGRPFGFTDEELARSILQQAQGKNFALREFVHALVASKEFRLK
ncbi:MAG: hypothetical protein RLZZ399_685 [Verrucomicrobiota bacterium]